MKQRLMPVIDDDEFIRTRVPMTKASVRHLSVLKLGLKEGDVVYDIGCGTGSVACEIAMQSESLSVYAMDMKPEACELTQQNADKFGLTNITVIKAKAPAGFETLKTPDCVFIGGSSGELREILRALYTVSRSVRIVINAVSLETMAEIRSLIGEFDLHDLSIEQVSVSRVRELGSYHLMMAENPVMIAAFNLGGRS